MDQLKKLAMRVMEAWDETVLEKSRDGMMQERMEALRAALAEQPAEQEPVYGDVLPPIGSRVYIRHGRDEDAHACIVTGYFAWVDLGGSTLLHRVFVRLVYEGTTTHQARLLRDCYPTAEAALAATPDAPQPTPAEQPQDEADDELCPSCRNSDIYACTCTTPRGKAEPSLKQALTDPENQPNQFGVEFLMNGPKFAFKVGVQQFTLDYEPTEPGEFEFMRDMLINAFSTFTPDVKAEPLLTVDAMRVEFERSYKGSLGLTRLSRGEYLSPAIETEWQQFVRKYTAPQPKAEQPSQSLDGKLVMGLAVIRELTGTQKTDNIEATIEAVRKAVAPQPAKPAKQEPVEVSPEFTDTARAALLWVLWHHQGGSSPVGQPIRFALGMGAHDRLNEREIAWAVRWAAKTGATTSDFHTPQPVKREPLTLREIAAATSTWAHVRSDDTIGIARAIIAAYERKNGIGGQV